MEASHWIGSITFELRSPERQALDPVRRELRNDHDRLLVRPLQQVLDRADRAGSLVRHRRIEIDLGLIGQNDLGEDLARRIADGIGRHFESGHQTARSSAKPHAGAEEQLLSFLAWGALAWPAPGRALEAICLSLAAPVGASILRFAERLRMLFANHRKAAERFVRQCPALLIFRITAILAGKSLMVGSGGGRPVAYVGEGQASRLAAILVRLARDEAVPREELEWLDMVIAAVPETSAGQTSGGVVEPRASPISAGARAADPAIAKADSRSNEADGAADEATLPETLPLDAAGTVLLHPFLAGLFKATGLLDEAGAFLSDDARSRAILLLNFAATGDHEAAEPDLVLAKLLCGLEISSLVPRAIDPTELERLEADALLRAVVSHWGALGDTSSAALRETFLKRPGRLQRDGEDWRLTVERRGVDVLIDRLPWAISLVKTPFMARPLKVDWR